MANAITQYQICRKPEWKSEPSLPNPYKISKTFPYIFSSDDTATTSFPETPRLSTYLIAFVISDLPFKSSGDNPAVLPHRVFARPSEIETTLLALQDGIRLLSAIEDYLQVNYSLPKMDQVAIPNFKSGGKFRCITNKINN